MTSLNTSVKLLGCLAAAWLDQIIATNIGHNNVDSRLHTSFIILNQGGTQVASCS